MPTDARYFADWTTPRTGIRYRLIFTPRARVLIDASGAITAGGLTWGDAPAFGEEPDDGSGWIRIPEGTIYAPKIPPYGWETLPLGWHSPPTLTLTLRSGRLDGDGDLEDLLYYVSVPPVEYEGEGRVPALTGYESSAVEVVPGEWRLLSTSNLWTLLTDDGDGTLDVLSRPAELLGNGFRVAFQGGHARGIGHTVTLDEVTGATITQLTLVHVLWLIASQVRPEDVAARVEHYRTATVHSHLWDVVWEGDSGERYAHVLGDPPGTDDASEFHVYRLAHVLDEMYGLLQSVYRGFTRLELATVIRNEPDGAYGRLRLREQSQTVANVAGPVNDEPLVVGFVKGSTSGELRRGGFLCRKDDEAGTLIEWVTADQFLIDVCEGCVQKVETVSLDHDQLSIHDWGVTESRIPLAIEPDGSPEGRTYWRGRVLELGAGTLSHTDADILGSQSGDVERIHAAAANVREHTGWTVPVALHTQPHAGERESVTWTGKLSHAGSEWQVVGSPLLTPNCLWYAGNLVAGGVPTGAGVPIRFHHHVGITDGATVYDECMNGVELPDPGELGPGVGSVGQFVYVTELWYPLRLAMLRMQANGGLPYAACRRVLALFGHRRQVAYPATVHGAVAGHDQLGKRAGEEWETAATLTGKTCHVIYPGRPLLVRTSLDVEAGMSEVRLLAIE